VGVASDPKAAEGKFYAIKAGSQTVYLDEAGLARARKTVLDALGPQVKRMVQTNKVFQDELANYYKAADVQNGFAQAVAHAVLIQVGRIEYPKMTTQSAADSLVSRLLAAYGAKDLGKVFQIMPEAEAALNAFVADMNRFGRELAGKALGGAIIFGVASAAAFAWVGALAVPMLAEVSVIQSLGGAEKVVGLGLAAINSAAGQFGNYTSGEKITVGGAVLDVVRDTLTAALTMGIASRIKPKYFDDLAKKMAGGIGKKLGIESAVMQRMIANFLSTTGQEAAKSAMGEGATLLGKSIRSGKAPTAEDFDEAVIKVLTTTVTAGFLGQIARSQKALAVQGRDVVRKTWFDKQLQDVLGKGGVIPDKLRMKLWGEVWGKVEEQVLQGTMAAVLKEGKAIDSAAMVEGGLAHLARASDIGKLVKAEIPEAVKRNKKLMSGGSNMV
jgi:hypothetical protein